MNLRTRKAKISDLDFLIELENQSFPPFQRNSKKNIRHSITSNFQEVILIEAGHKPFKCVGAITLFKYKKSLRIYSVAVLPKFQNMGIGDFLLKQVNDFVSRNQLEKITLEAHAGNTRLIEWYKKREFKTVDLLEDYYSKGENAVKMEKTLQTISKTTKTSNLIVINQPFKWKYPEINAKIITVKEYINNPVYQNNADYRVFNLCSSYKYQSYGYYVSLLASARGQRAIPSSTTIRDFRILNVIHSAAYDLNDIILKTLGKKEE